MTGLLKNVNAPNIASSYWIRRGSYAFPTVAFKCNGSIQGVRGIAYFTRNLYYNRTLVLNLNLWRRKQSHYVPTMINSNATFSPEEIASGSASAAAPFYFNNPRNYTFSINLGDASINVIPGDILGISLPLANTLINHIPIGLADDFQIPYFDTLPSACWSPTLGRTLCNSFEIDKAPLLSLNFVPTSVPTGKLVVCLIYLICIWYSLVIVILQVLCIFASVCKFVLYQILWWLACLCLMLFGCSCWFLVAIVVYCTRYCSTVLYCTRYAWSDSGVGVGSAMGLQPLPPISYNCGQCL